ncbi:MAG: CDP-alcohol phosphatidyltransferase family protein [Aequorivita sp.]
MISIYKIKPKFQQLLKPILIGLHRWGITANQITIASVVLSFLIGVAFWNSSQYHILFLVVPIGLLIRMALNALDGMMATTYNQQSKKGEILNELGDVFSDVFIFFPLLKYEADILYLVVIFICLGVINEFAGVLGKAVSGERRYDGPMGKSDRAFVISVLALLYFFSVNLGNASFWIFIVLNVLILLSTFIRIKKSLQ